jgi:polysaccharide biosynthesis protein PslH
MKVLVVLAQPPLPEGEAPARCAVALLRGLRAQGLDVKAVAARQYYAQPGDPPEDLPVEVIRVDPPRGGWRTLRPLHRPRPELSDGAFRARVAELARDADVVHLEETQTIWAAPDPGPPSALHVHYLVRRDRSLGLPWHRQFREVVEFALAERRATRSHDFLVASSPLVGEALQRVAPAADVTIAPLSVDSRYYEPAPLDAGPIAGFIGTGTWPPTREALRSLVTDVWPRIRERVPDARLRIAGRGTEQLVPPGESGIETLGEIPSAAEFMQSLSLLVYPLRRGSGMKVKVLESIASGVPVVTTPAGSEGIEAGAGVIVATGADELAAAAGRLLLDSVERQSRGAAARAAYLERYTPEAATAPLASLYRRMMR